MLFFLSALMAFGATGPEGGTLRRFEYLEDFENEPEQGSVYTGWERVSSPAHPAWNRIELVRDDPAGTRSGQRYLRLSTQGGATAFQMQKKVAWEIDPARAYRLSALVRLTATRRNIARITILWLNRRFELLDETTTPPASGSDGWRELSIDLPAVPAGTMWAALRLSFEGPDVRGECCFDRLMLTRPPRLRLAPADRTIPVFDPGRPPQFNLLARELAEGEHRAEFRLRGRDGAQTVLRSNVPVRDGAAVPLELPALAPGAYGLIAAVSGEDGVPVDRECPLLVVDRPWLSMPGQASLFGGSFDPFENDYLDPRELSRLGLFQRTRVTLWRRAAPGGRRPPEPARLFEFVRRLSEVDAMSVVGRIDSPPAEIFPDVDPATLEKGLAAFAGIERSAWEPQLRSLTTRYREFVPLWQPGASLVPTANLMKTFDGEPITTIEAPGPEELLRRLILHAAARPGGEAFIPVDRLLDADGFPGPAFLALRAANAILPGATPRMDLLERLGPPVRAAFEKDGRAILVLWTDGAEVEREFNLGPEAEVFAPLGDPRRHVPGERIKVGAMPLFIGRVDPSFLETQLSLRLVDPADPTGRGNTLPLRTDPITRILTFRNRSRRSEITSLRVKIEEPVPAGWIVRPLIARDLSIPPNKELNHELAFLLPQTEEEGEKPLAVELVYTQDGRSQSVRERLIIRVIPQIAIDVRVADVPGSEAARKVSVRFTNATGRKMTLVAAVRLPDRPEQTEPLGTLEPGSLAERDLVYTVKDLRSLGSGPLKIEVLCEEAGGERLHARKVVPLR